VPTIHEQVGEKLKTISPTVEGRVVDLLVDKEVNRRVEIISAGLTRLEEIQKEGRKLEKPDVEAYDDGGNLSSAAYSKARTEERKKLTERFDKMSKAIDKALAGDTGDLAQLVQQKSDKS
jgi:predicted S18 family serine protease